MNTLFTICSIFLSLATASGVLVHDAHFDKVASASQGAVDAATISSTAHPHAEYQSGTLHGFSYSSPSYPAEQPRYKRHLMQNAEPRGRHAFDNSYLPLIS